ncbi:Spo0E family sporulation regulatory protein-aspartic acid phosphatase [Clostridium neonatale]|uniref:Spo0E family sporulation regulatory protein-aspartic acid phosphatase n=1 Tax=Clostridium neonatale TaxID=137838 RepID=UPI00291C4353|nr:Aspartyl-phosphate phosphatase Spo0E family protein [Clostridium neonatale]
MKKESVENLREKLYDYVVDYGIDDPRTILVSQQLDKYIVKEQIDITETDSY